MVAADHVLFDDTHYCLQMDDCDEHDTIVMQDEDKTLDTKSDEVKEEDDQELIIIPFKETCSKHIRGFRRHSCLYKYRLICAWQQDSRQTCTCVTSHTQKMAWRLELYLPNIFFDINSGTFGINSKSKMTHFPYLEKESFFGSGCL